MGGGTDTLQALSLFRRSRAGARVVGGLRLASIAAAVSLMSAQALGAPLGEDDLAAFLEGKREKTLDRRALATLLDRTREGRMSHPETYRFVVRGLDDELLGTALEDVERIHGARLPSGELGWETRLCADLALGVAPPILGSLPRFVFRCLALLPPREAKARGALCSVVSDDAAARRIAGCAPAGRRAIAGTARFDALSLNRRLEIILLKAARTPPKSADERELLLEARRSMGKAVAHMGWPTKTLLENHADTLPLDVLLEMDFTHVVLTPRGREGSPWLALARGAALRKRPGPKAPAEIPLCIQWRKCGAAPEEWAMGLGFKTRVVDRIDALFERAGTGKIMRVAFSPGRDGAKAVQSHLARLSSFEFFMDGSPTGLRTTALLSIADGRDLLKILWTREGGLYVEHEGTWTAPEGNISMDRPMQPGLSLTGNALTMASLDLGTHPPKDWDSTVKAAAFAISSEVRGALVEGRIEGDGSFTAAFLSPRHTNPGRTTRSTLFVSDSRITLSTPVPSFCSGAPRCTWTVELVEGPEVEDLRRRLEPPVKTADAPRAPAPESESASISESMRAMMGSLQVFIPSFGAMMKSGGAAP